MSSFRNARPRRHHKERSQLLHRVNKHGLLEKKKDYKLRARDNHRKEDRLKLLAEKAAFRNPDEFYYAMIKSAGTKGGVAKKSRNYEDAIPLAQRSIEERRLRETQDARYIEYKASMERAKVEKLEKDLWFSDVAKEAKRTHTVFVSDEDELETFDPKNHFGAEKSQSKEEDAADGDLKKGSSVLSSRTAQKLRRAKERAYRELDQRKDREEKLRTVWSDINRERNLLGKGKKRKVREADPETGAPALYKWRQRRAR